VQPRWTAGPATITLVRHAESVGNVADAAAHEAAAEVLDLPARDADVPLSDTGRQQATALGRWLARHRDVARPDLVVSSPYRRALDTARLAFDGLPVEIDQDERLRERDLGLFDGLTGRGIRARYPQEAERRSRLGKFYYQPPSGESWVDVVLRVRSFLHDLARVERRHVWVFTHQAVIMSHRLVLEGLDEQHVLRLSRDEPLPNVARTVYRRRDDRMVLEVVADASVVDEDEAQKTHEEGAADVRQG
jgi:broad specificity phosphatase PhoE